VGGFLIIVVLLAAAWFFFALPVRRRRAQHAAMQDSVDVGDEIITAGGLHATVREIEEDELRIEIAPGVVAVLDRRAVAAVAREEEVEVAAEAPPEAPGNGTSAEPG
jgi:preprotein translocase subunit YajC